MDYIQALKSFGFTTNEAKVYFACLELGSASAPEIGKRSGMLRTTVYEILKKLLNQGVASYVFKAKVRYFEVVDPQRLVELIDERKQKLLSVVDELIAIKKSVIKKPTIEFFEGKEGLRTILESILKDENKEYIALGNNEAFREVLGIYVEQFIHKRKEKGIGCRLLIEPGEKTTPLINQDVIEQRMTKTISELKTTKAEIFLYANKIAIFTLINNNPLGVVIEEENIQQLFKTIFEKLWKENKTPSKVE